MGRLLAIDYGEKRIGLAHTDELQLIASPLETVAIKDVFNFLFDYFEQESVDSIIVGDPKTLNNKPAEISKKIKLFTDKLKTLFDKPIYFVDERFTSKMALKTMVMVNTSQKQRRQKKDIDKISAALILQTYLDRKYKT